MKLLDEILKKFEEIIKSFDEIKKKKNYHFSFKFDQILKKF